MYTLLIGVLTSIIVLTGYYQSQWDNHMSTQNISSYVASNIANNIISYAKVVKEYADYTDIKNQVISDNVLQTYLSYGFNKLANYRAVIIMYKDRKYEIISWDSFFVRTASDKEVLAELAYITNKKKAMNGTSWFIPLIIINDNCTGTIINRNLEAISKRINDYGRLFNNLCQVSFPGGFTLGKYNLLIEMIDK